MYKQPINSFNSVSLICLCLTTTLTELLNADKQNEMPQMLAFLNKNGRKNARITAFQCDVKVDFMFLIY